VKNEAQRGTLLNAALGENRATWAGVHIDAMRGAAALIVVIGHARSLFFVSMTGNTETGQLTIGDEAVMVFFVLSGYLVGGSVLRDMKARTWNWLDYLVKRLVRLLIVLIPAVFIGIVIDNIGFRFLAHGGSIYTAPVGQVYVLPVLFSQIQSVPIILGNIVFLQTILVPTVGTNATLWSLSNEFWYYVLFPLGMLVLRYERNILLRVAYGTGAALIIWMIGLHASVLFLTWLLGATLSIVPRRIPARCANGAVIIATAAFCMVFVCAKKFDLPLYVAELMIAVLVSALVYTIICQTTPTTPSLYGTAARWSSNISYTLYLTHLPFLILLCALVSTPWVLAPVSMASFAKFGVGIVGALVWAAALYYVFESRTNGTRTVISALIRTRARAVKQPISRD